MKEDEDEPGRVEVGGRRSRQWPELQSLHFYGGRGGEAVGELGVSQSPERRGFGSGSVEEQDDDEHVVVVRASDVVGGEGAEGGKRELKRQQ